MNWRGIIGAVGKWSVRVARTMPMVDEAISLVEMFVDKKGEEKREAALMVLQALMEAAETGSGRDLVNNAEVLDTARKYMDASVAFRNALAKYEAAKKR